MRLPVMLIVAVAVLILAINGERSAVSGDARGEAMTRVNLLLDRSASEETKPGRDPFFGHEMPAKPSAEQSAAAAKPLVAAVPALPSFRIVGKQHDEHGWLVFIAAPERNGLLWTVREGESFGEGYRVAKLAPPVLVIQAKDRKLSRKFNIGTDEE